MDYNIVIEHLLGGKNVRATKYISPKEVVRATRKRFGGKFSRNGIDIVLTICRPNFVEREFIKKYKKINGKGRFPTNEIVLKAYEPKKTNPKRK